MTHHPIKVLEDGTRVYSNGTRYTPMPDEKRVNKRRKPAVAGAVLFQGNWYLPLDLLPLEARVLPDTVPDEEAYLHAAKSRKCRCEPCRRPAARKWRRRYLRDQRGSGPSATVSPS